MINPMECSIMSEHMSDLNTLSALEARQIALELDSLDRGCERYYRNQARNGLGGRSGSLAVFNDLVFMMEEVVRTSQRNIREGLAKAGKPAHWHRMYVNLDARKTSWLTIFEMLGSHADEHAMSVQKIGITTSAISKRIGLRVTDQFRYDTALEIMANEAKNDKNVKYEIKRIKDGIKQGSAKNGKTKEKAL